MVDCLELTKFTLTSVLSACGLLLDCKIGEQIHGSILKIGFGSNAGWSEYLLHIKMKIFKSPNNNKKNLVHIEDIQLKQRLNIF